jgi:NAD(P)-dependent dehydrogenase (short-subunit alcohol dehydrogenase family)
MTGKATAGWPLPVPASTDAAARRAAVSGRVAVVTGASRGLGAGMAAHFASAGLHLGLCARHRPELVAATRPRAHDGRVDPPEAPFTAAVNVADPDALEQFADAVVERFGRIDLWINNAGVLSPIGPLADAAPDEVALNLAVNVNGPAFGSRLFARHVRDRPGEGVLVNISSGASIRPYEGWAPYCAAKAALDMLTEVLAAEGAAWGLRAYAVAPGVVDTDMQAAIRASDEQRFPDIETFHQLHRDNAFNSAAWVADRILDLAFGDAEPRQIRLRVPDQPKPEAAR